MAGGNNTGNRAVFVGNIPYGVTEEVIEEYLGRVGQVLNFRLVVDKETGKPKGYGFAEYADADAAASAVRNLNATELHGRQLRVDYANEGNKDRDGDMKDSKGGHADGQDADQPGELPPLPLGTDIKPNLSAEDSISKTLATLPPLQLMDILQQLQKLANDRPAQAATLFQTQPQVSYAAFQALLLMKLVDANTLTSVMQQVGMPSAAAAPPTQPPPSQPTPQTYGGYPLAPQFAGSVPTPPVQPPYQPPPAAAAPTPAIPAEKAGLIAQLMAMPVEQINALPPDQRNQIMALRQQYAGAFPPR